LRTELQTFKDFDLILYQAGADLHIDDPLGGVLDSDQMRQRDAIVFDAAKRAGVALAWNLAGGYQEPLSKVVEIHMATMQECTRVYVRPGQKVLPASRRFTVTKSGPRYRLFQSPLPAEPV
jgi:acetoin utilization deacetylase AcuC-like enzyme